MFSLCLPRTPALQLQSLACNATAASVGHEVKSMMASDRLSKCVDGRSTLPADESVAYQSTERKSRAVGSSNAAWKAAAID